jgi:hypothetical protein
MARAPHAAPSARSGAEPATRTGALTTLDPRLTAARAAVTVSTRALLRSMGQRTRARMRGAGYLLRRHTTHLDPHPFPFQCRDDPQGAALGRWRGAIGTGALTRVIDISKSEERHFKACTTHPVGGQLIITLEDRYEVPHTSGNLDSTYNTRVRSSTARQFNSNSSSSFRDSRSALQRELMSTAAQSAWQSTKGSGATSQSANFTWQQESVQSAACVVKMRTCHKPCVCVAPSIPWTIGRC